MINRILIVLAFTLSTTIGYQTGFSLGQTSMATKIHLSCNNHNKVKFNSIEYACYTKDKLI